MWLLYGTRMAQRNRSRVPRGLTCQWAYKTEWCVTHRRIPQFRTTTENTLSKRLLTSLYACVSVLVIMWIAVISVLPMVIVYHGWTNSCRYLGVYLCASNHFKSSFSNAKKSFYRSFNSIFGKSGRLASEEVILHLFKAKCPSFTVRFRGMLYKQVRKTISWLCIHSYVNETIQNKLNLHHWWMLWDVQLEAYFSIDRGMQR